MATKLEETLWIWKDDGMIKKKISYVSLLYDTFDRILLNAASIQGMQHINVKVSREEISVWYDLKTELARNVFDDAIEYVTNFTIKTANGYARTKELFKKKKKDLTIRKWSSSTSNENWTMVSFKPRLGRLDMKRLDDGINLNPQPNEIKRCLWVFVNAHIDDPGFDSQTLTTNKENFGLKCKLRREILEKVKDLHLSKKDFKIPKQEDAKFADTMYS
ncbi:DNA topoisomerase 2 [Tanacetum coccineum]